MNRFIIISAICLLIFGCTYHNEEDLYSNSCDTIIITYSKDIKPIFENNCYGCHSVTNPPRGFLISDYDLLKQRILNGKLSAVINHQEGFPAMPFGQNKLNDCTIRKIETWINRGILNN